MLYYFYYYLRMDINQIGWKLKSETENDRRFYDWPREEMLLRKRDFNSVMIYLKNSSKILPIWGLIMPLIIQSKSKLSR